MWGVDTTSLLFPRRNRQPCRWFCLWDSQCQAFLGSNVSFQFSFSFHNSWKFSCGLHILSISRMHGVACQVRCNGCIIFMVSFLTWYSRVANLWWLWKSHFEWIKLPIWQTLSKGVTLPYNNKTPEHPWFSDQWLMIWYGLGNQFMLGS